MIGFLLALALLFAPDSAHAGMGTSRDSNYNVAIVAAGGGYTGPGDIVSGAVAWYGLRAYTAAIAAAATQKLVNIRNTATSETCDVIVATNGGFGNVANCSASSSGDTVAVFCAESSGSCAVTEAYDQSGNANNATQVTAADQPTLTPSCIGSLPCMAFVGATPTTLIATISTVIVPYSMSAMGKTTHSTNADFLISGNTSFNSALAIQNTFSDGPYIRGGSGVDQIAWNNSYPVLFALNGSVTGSTTSFINANGTVATGTSVSGSFVTPITIGGNSSPLTGMATEMGLWPSAFTTGNATSICQNQQAYYGAGNFGASC